MNILITGGAGFIGSNLADKLILTDNVIVVDNFNDYYSPVIKEKNISKIKENKKYKLYRYDLKNKKDIAQIFDENKIDVVVHLAACAGVRASIQNPKMFVDNNITATINLLEVMKDYNVKKLIFASSSSVYGNNSAKIFSEDLDVSNPISPYAATKLACEQFIYTYSKLYDIQSICLRFFTVFGRRQRPDLAIAKFIKLINQDERIQLYGDGTTLRDYTYIDDIINGIVSSINYSDTKYEIINLGAGNPICLIDVVKTIEKVLNKKAEIDWLPMQDGDVFKTYADISKAKKLLNYTPKTKFMDGIELYVKWLNS